MTDGKFIMLMGTFDVFWEISLLIGKIMYSDRELCKFNNKIIVKLFPNLELHFPNCACMSSIFPDRVEIFYNIRSLFPACLAINTFLIILASSVIKSFFP
jgi:hypothetical protein